MRLISYAVSFKISTITMINRKLCVVVCCLGVGFAHVAQAQSSGGDDQSKALDALRQAEKGPAPATKTMVAATPAPAPAPAPASSDADNAQALDALRAAEKSGPIAAPANAAPAATPTPAPAATQAVAAVPANPEDEARALEALHSAELSQPQKSNASAAANRPVQAQYSAPPPKEDDAETVASKAALEQFEASGGVTPENPERQSEVEALRRQHAQEEAAFRVETLQKQIKSQPAVAAPVVTGPAPDSKEGKLADLLRRYNADEITPLEYHTQRAKIIAEP
jgi:hypothetical protein